MNQVFTDNIHKMTTLSAVKEDIITVTTGGFASIASAFVRESLSHMIPWLIVTLAVIVCDLAFGIRKSKMMSEEVRFSRACRRTMGKIVTYFSFVCMVCMINTASGGEYGIDKWSCLFVCFLEFCSIVSNILKPKGYTLNVKALLSAVIGKVAKVNKQDIEEIIEKNK